jgi:hypothetical protein
MKNLEICTMSVYPNSFKVTENPHLSYSQGFLTSHLPRPTVLATPGHHRKANTTSLNKSYYTISEPSLIGIEVQPWRIVSRTNTQQSLGSIDRKVDQRTNTQQSLGSVDRKVDLRKTKDLQITTSDLVRTERQFERPFERYSDATEEITILAEDSISQVDNKCESELPEKSVFVDIIEDFQETTDLDEVKEELIKREREIGSFLDNLDFLDERRAALLEKKETNSGSPSKSKTQHPLRNPSAEEDVSLSHSTKFKTSKSSSAVSSKVGSPRLNEEQFRLLRLNLLNRSELHVVNKN